MFAAYRTGKFSGIGFVLGGGFAGIDLDDVRNPTTGEITAGWAAELIATAGTFADVSPSGTGVKLFGLGAWAGDWHKKPHPSGIGELEIYDAARFFTLMRDPDAAYKLASVAVAGAVGVLLHMTELTTADATPYLSPDDARGLETLKGMWAKNRADEPMPDPYGPAFQILAADPVQRVVAPLARLLVFRGDKRATVQPDEAKRMLKEAEAEIANIKPFE